MYWWHPDGSQQQVQLSWLLTLRTQQPTLALLAFRNALFAAVAHALPSRR
jgi:hypothetical protein